VRAAFLVLALVLAACSGGHGGASATTHPLDPFATGAPFASGAAATAGSSSESAPSSSAAAPNAAALAVGQCFNTTAFVPGSEIDVSTAQIVDCAGPHQHEVYAVVVEPDPPGASYPGDEPMDELASDQCLAAFTPYTGVDYQASSYDIANARPDRASWSRGDRNVICALHDADFGELTGSAKAPSS
jgi:hypothetical protein